MSARRRSSATCGSRMRTLGASTALLALTLGGCRGTTPANGGTEDLDPGGARARAGSQQIPPAPEPSSAAESTPPAAAAGPGVQDPGEQPRSTPAASNGESAAPAQSIAEDAPARDEGLAALLRELGVRLLAEQGAVEVDGWVNMQAGLVELFACAPQGKTHEAVVVLDCVPSGLHAGLLALGLQPGRPVEIGTDGSYRPPEGDPVELRVRWIDAGGTERLARAEDWIWNEHAERAMAPAAWIFAGSFLQEVSGSADGRTYAANSIKTLVSTYHDASSILENPHSEGIDDTVYYANEAAVPEVGTPVTVVFRRAP